jgi:hypothetical protein
MTRSGVDELDAARAACRAMSAPDSHKEWRRVSTALRRVRRIQAERRLPPYAEVSCGPHRYLFIYDHGPMRCYRRGGLGSLSIISFHAFRYREGDTDGRLEFALLAARRCKQEGPIPLPDLLHWPEARPSPSAQNGVG